MRRATAHTRTSTVRGAISIHALRGEGDRMKSAARCSSMPFLSTPSARRATTDSVSTLNTTVISIHALREEGDAIIHTPYQAISSYFYPRPPRGGRQFSDLTFFTSSIFLSTPSARRATSCSLQIWLAPDNFYPRPPAVVPIEVLISIHALREEGDPDRPRPAGLYSAFLSTPSARRATCLG